MGVDRARLAQHLPPLHLVALHPAQQAAHVVPGQPLVQRLLEHLHPGHHHLAPLAHAHDLDLLARLDHAALDPPGHHRAPPLDAEDVLDRHQERLVHRPLRGRDVVVDRLHQLQDRPVGRISSGPARHSPAPPGPSPG